MSVDGNDNEPLWNSGKLDVDPRLWSWRDTDIYSPALWFPIYKTRSWGQMLFLTPAWFSVENFFVDKLSDCPSPSRVLVPWPAASTPPGNLSERQLLRPHPDLLNEKPWHQGGAQKLCGLTSPTGDLGVPLSLRTTALIQIEGCVGGLW